MLYALCVQSNTWQKSLLPRKVHETSHLEITIGNLEQTEKSAINRILFGFYRHAGTRNLESLRSTSFNDMKLYLFSLYSDVVKIVAGRNCLVLCKQEKIIKFWRAQQFYEEILRKLLCWFQRARVRLSVCHFQPSAYWLVRTDRSLCITASCELYDFTSTTVNFMFKFVDSWTPIKRNITCYFCYPNYNPSHLNAAP